MVEGGALSITIVVEARVKRKYNRNRWVMFLVGIVDIVKSK